MRVLCFGSRAWTDRRAIEQRLKDLPENAVIVHGDARKGADRIVDQTARALGFTVDPYPAEWEKHKPSDPRRKNPAGVIRNIEMADTGIDLGIGWRAEGESNGTDHMESVLRERGVPVEMYHARVIV